MLAVIWNSPQMLLGTDPEMDYIPETSEDVKYLNELGAWLTEGNKIAAMKVEAVILDSAEVLSAGDLRPEKLGRLEGALERFNNLSEGVGKKTAELRGRGWRINGYLQRYKRGGRPLGYIPGLTRLKKRRANGVLR